MKNRIVQKHSFILSDAEIARLKKYDLKSFDLIEEIGHLLNNFAIKDLQEFVQYSNLITSGRPRISELLQVYLQIKHQLTSEKNPYQLGLILIRLLVFQFMVEGCTKQMLRLILKALICQFPKHTLELQSLNIKEANLNPLEKNILSILDTDNKFPTLSENTKELCTPYLHELRHAIAHHRFYIESQNNNCVIYYQPKQKKLLRKSAKIIEVTELFKKMDNLQEFWISFLGAYDCVSSRLIESKQTLDLFCSKCGNLFIYTKIESPPTDCNFCGVKYA